MADANEAQQHEMALAMRLRLLREQAHGAPAGEVNVLIGPDSVAAWLDAVLADGGSLRAETRRVERLWVLRGASPDPGAALNR